MFRPGMRWYEVPLFILELLFSIIFSAIEEKVKARRCRKRGYHNLTKHYHKVYNQEKCRDCYQWFDFDEIERMRGVIK